MRLLLDEMHAIAVAVALRESGVDVVAAAERSELRGRADEDILEAGAAEGRVVVTENVRDFAPLATTWGADGRPHAGIVFTHPRRFPRATMAYPGTLIAALRVFTGDPPIAGGSWTWWLE